MQRLKEIAFLLQKRSSSQISLVLRAIVRRSMVPRQCRCARVLVSRQVVWPLEHSRVSSSFLTNFQALICTSSASAWPGVAPAPPRASQRPKRTESNSPNPLRLRGTRYHFFHLEVKIRIDDTPTGDNLMSRRPSSARVVVFSRSAVVWALAMYRTFSRVIADSFLKIFWLRIPD